MEWASSVWKWEDERNLTTLNCHAETWLLSAHYKLVMRSVMSSTLCFHLVGMVQQDCFCSANLHHLLEHFQAFNMSLEEPDLPQIKVPQDSPQDPVLWPAFITTTCFWRHPVVWEIVWLSSALVLRLGWRKLWDTMALTEQHRSAQWLLALGNTTCTHRAWVISNVSISSGASARAGGYDTGPTEDLHVSGPAVGLRWHFLGENGN